MSYFTIRGTQERKKEQEEYGVFYDDDYDYLQHLKPRTDTSLEPLPSHITVVEAKKADVKKACLIDLIIFGIKFRLVFFMFE